MASAEPMDSATLPQQNFSPVAGLLSYLVPGLGQVMQGRIGKGLLFFVCLYSLFFMGQYLGDWRTVYINAGRPPAKQGPLDRSWLIETVTRSGGFFCQFWIGVAAWPAIVQHFADVPPEKEHPYLGNYQRRPTEEELNNQVRNSDKSPDLGWVYTVIAGVLNILVIYDALAGPAHGSSRAKLAIDADRKEPAVT